MFTHALRCTEDDYPELLHNAELLGVLEVVDGQVIMKDGGCWDYIGYKYLEDGSILDDGNGNKYLHINAATPIDVDTVARALAEQYPEIQEGLSQFNRFFITDPQTGKWVWPEYPLRVFL